MTPGTPHEPLLRHFRYQHLADPRLRAFSQRYASLAEAIVDTISPTTERNEALRELMRAKDQGVRALLDDLYPATEPPPNRPVDVAQRPSVQETEPVTFEEGCAVLVGYTHAPIVCGYTRDSSIHTDPSAPDYHEFNSGS